MGNKQVVAIFDFDGTLTKGDTLIPFLFHCFGTTKAIIGLLLTSPYILGYTLKLISNNTAKAKVIKHFFKNKRVTFLNQQAESFVQNKIDARLRDNVVKRLRWHQNNDHTSVL